MRIVIIAFILIINLTTYAHSEDKNTNPMTKEQIDTIEEGEKIGDQLNSLRMSFESMMRERKNDCIKAFGHDQFCSCLNDNLAVGLSFKDYIVITINSKDELNYNELSKEDKGVIDKAIKIREQCVGQLQKK